VGYDVPVTITRDDVRRVAALARLHLTADEIEHLTADLGHLLEHFARIQALDTTGVEPTAHVDDFGARLRDDAVTNPPASDALLANAPAREGRLFRVPRIIE
jgi:aspartyl-tRNA(Asn)/glutamyl-tRNA(Gln) amidotransferase subunit C